MNMKKVEDLKKKFNELDEETQWMYEFDKLFYLCSELLVMLGEKYKIEDELKDLLDKYSISYYRAVLDPHYKGGWAYTRDYKNQILKLIKEAKKGGK